MTMKQAPEHWDVVVIGGALAGASTACLLRSDDPARKVLILERSLELGRRVGESTVEVSAYFLRRVLGLAEHLSEEHLPKQGLRYFAANERSADLPSCSEIGSPFHVRLPAYQIDRAVLDEHVLAQAQRAGAEVRRGVRVKAVQLRPGGRQIVETEAGGNMQAYSARWVVDASGVAAVLARQEGWLRPNREHPIAACWARWTGVRSWDDPTLNEGHPGWAKRAHAGRNLATNHLTGYGWWAWWIPLKGGDVSIGVVYDQRLCELPPGGSLGERLRAQLCTHPAGRELLANATYREEDVHYRANLAYASERMATDGAVLVGDAAAFLDPFYSPGLDWIGFTACGAAALINACAQGAPMGDAVARHNRRFVLGYERWFRALYRDKYYYLGDHELMQLAFRLDVGLYYLGTVLHVFRFGRSALEFPAFARPLAGPAACLMAAYNRRLAAVAQARRRRGSWGRRNAGRFYPFPGYVFGPSLAARVAAAMIGWLGLELREGWRLPLANCSSSGRAPSGPAEVIHRAETAS